MSVVSTLPSGNGFANPEKTGASSTFANGLPSATIAKALGNSKLPVDGNSLNPDDLFTKHTVAEIRGIQNRLKAEADAKQEELRLMVGERYRDLLQASSSIISIAQSSRRVLEALEDCQGAVRSQQVTRLPPKTSQTGAGEDRHLHVLQVLSAHIKLLLDAPEHLWRLIEKRKYFPAAWLFLLSRVIHRALTRKEEVDDQPWASDGVDVLAEFPLVQRQWDVVSQFRAQIIHKSTLTLRDVNLSAEETCAILVTLYLLDSRPLKDTLATLLTQRSKSLQTALTWAPGQTPVAASSVANGHSKPSLSVVRDTITALKRALGTICQTVCTARSIFHDNNSDDTSTPVSLVFRVLRSMAIDTPETNVPNFGLPDELYLTTPNLLSHLTSSASFSLLPTNLVSYKPYVDLDAASSSLTQSQFLRKLSEWFQASCSNWQSSATRWLYEIRTAKDVWTIRTSIRKSVVGFDLTNEERRDLLRSFDNICQARIIEIWSKGLSEAQKDFKERLHHLVALSPATPETDVGPIDFLFRPLGVPHVSQSGKVSSDNNFADYQHNLKRQLVGRSGQLDGILSCLEACARTIRIDLLHLKESSPDDSDLVDTLRKGHEPVADRFLKTIVSIVEEESRPSGSPSNDDDDDDSLDLDGLIALSRVTNDLLHVSLCAENVGCSSFALQGFKDKLAQVHASIIRQWREGVVDDVAMNYRIETPLLRTSPVGPSSQILHTLLALSDAIQQLGVVLQPQQHKKIAADLLRSSIEAWIGEAWDSADEQVIYDLEFTKRITALYGDEWSDISDALERKLREKSPNPALLEGIEKVAAEALTRTQTLLFAVLPLHTSQTPPLARVPLANTPQNYQPALDLAKPTPRFGMLLVESS